MTIASLSFSKTEAPFPKRFSSTLKRKASGLKSVFEKLLFQVRDELVWKFDQTVEIKLRFQIFPT